jgi:hypothetical protein
LQSWRQSKNVWQRFCDEFLSFTELFRHTS